MHKVVVCFFCKGEMALDKDDSRIVCLDRASVGTITTVNEVIFNHELIENCSSIRLHLFCSLLKTPKCCLTCTAVVDNFEIYHIHDLRETNEVIRSGCRCSSHKVTIVYLVYDTMKKRCIIKQQMQIIYVIPRIKVVCVIKDWECFAYNRYMNPTLRLLINNKLQNSGKAEHQVKTIIKKIQLNETVRETHSRNFIM